jgi:hypothetical protein
MFARFPVDQGFLAAMLLAAVFVAAPRAQTPAMPLDDVRPGMVGVGRTVFAGEKQEEFQAHILGVLRNVIAPKRDLILARLAGGPLARTGVIAGMSGSPVYIDGRLIGAVSYALGQFATEPIAAITPIGEMIDATAARTAPTPGSRPVAIAWPYTPRALIDVWSRDLAQASPYGDSAPDARFVAGAGPDMAALGALLRPIAVPLVSVGLDPAVLDPLAPAFVAGGLVPVTGDGQPAASAPGARRLQPGDAVGVGLMTGDFVLGATGTVTHVDGDRVYAFGHPLYNLGPTEFPMTTADVQVVLPSLFQSMKLASLGPVVGTLQQDRATGIAGTLGALPSMIPVSITLTSDRAGTRAFSFGVVRDVTFTPLLTYLAVANVLTSYERGAGPASFSVRGTAAIRSQGEISFEDIFTGDQPAGGAAASVAGPLTMLLKNALEPVNLERITLTIDAVEQQRTARIERVWLDTARPRPGQNVGVVVSLRTARGDEVIRQVSIPLPSNPPNGLQLVVADAARTGADDRRDVRGAEAQQVTQLIRTINRARRNNRVYVRLTASEPGAVVNGEPMAALPPSVLSVIEADRSGGTAGTLRSATLGEWELPLDFAVTGARQLPLRLDQP